MKTCYLLFAISGLALAACKQKESPSTDLVVPMDAAFKTIDTPSAAPASRLQSEDSSESLRNDVAQVQAQLRAQDYPDAILSLQKIQRATNLTAGQVAAINETMAKVQTRLIEQAANGDPRAKKAIEDFRRNLPQ